VQDGAVAGDEDGDGRARGDDFDGIADGDPVPSAQGQLQTRLADQRLRCLAAPRVGEQFPEFPGVDGGEPDQNRGKPVIVRLGEELVRVRPGG
jgi:hypothetical protein